MSVSPENAPPSADDPVRVMLVDDSAVIRGMLARFMEGDPEIKVLASVPNGQLAISSMARVPVDVVVLDIEMPVMDGMTALPLILKADPAVQVIIASGLTKENAAITFKAMQMGAAECLAKPTSKELAESNVFRNALLEKVKVLGLLARKKRSGGAKNMSVAPSSPLSPTVRSMPSPAAAPAPAKRKFSLRQEIARIVPDAIAVGSSTGGPQALLQFFSDLKGSVRQPIFVTQHMPPTFTTILAEHIAKHSGIKCKEAIDGEIVEGGHVYLAPGNFHMLVRAQDGKKVIALNQDAPESFCRPAVDPMLRSILGAYGKKVLAVILTGMGVDGLKSCQQAAEAGGVVLAQDEASSVVWGMPGAVAMAGICTQVLPLASMARVVRDYADGGRMP